MPVLGLKLGMGTHCLSWVLQDRASWAPLRCLGWWMVILLSCLRDCSLFFETKWMKLFIFARTWLEENKDLRGKMYKGSYQVLHKGKARECMFVLSYSSIVTYLTTLPGQLFSSHSVSAQDLFLVPLWFISRLCAACRMTLPALFLLWEMLFCEALAAAGPQPAALAWNGALQRFHWPCRPDTGFCQV